MAACLRQNVPGRWTVVRKRYFTKDVCVHTRGDKGAGVRYRSQLSSKSEGKEQLYRLWCRAVGEQKDFFLVS